MKVELSTIDPETGLAYYKLTDTIPAGCVIATDGQTVCQASADLAWLAPLGTTAPLGGFPWVRNPCAEC